jgi:hypothetical protein
VKQRTLGNIRLISHLYKSEVVNEKILHYCIQDMLGDGKSDPVEDNVEVRGLLRCSRHLRAIHMCNCGTYAFTCLPSRIGDQGV